MGTSLVVDSRKHYRDAFTNPAVKLYIPTDDRGNIVKAEKATRLEFWESDPRVHYAHLPEVLNEIGVWTRSLLKSSGDTEFSFLTRSVAYGTIKALNEWTLTLSRVPSGDIYLCNITIKE